MHHAAACTCPGESHPGPARSDGSYVGRSAPEIDVFEALIDPDGGKVCTAFTILNCLEQFHRCLCLPNGLHMMSVLSTYQFVLVLNVCFRPSTCGRIPAVI